MNPLGMSSAARASHPVDTEGDFQLATWQSYIKGLRNFWRTEAYQAVVSTVDGTLQPTELERRYADLAAYRLYAWLERYSQQMKYYGRRGLVDLACDQKQHCSELLDEAKNKGPGRVEIDADFEVPSYVRESHTHQHVGGVWSNPAAAFAYEASTSGFSFALGESSAPMRVYADAASALANMAQHPVGKVIDIGCAIGESTRALKAAFPDAEVLGVDVCAAAVLLAHLRANERGEKIDFSQRAAEDLHVPSESVDLIASHWLYHEMPVKAIRAALGEAHRALRKGGLFMAFDMHLVPGGNIGQWLHWGYAKRNNEPFAVGFSQMDLRQELKNLGFCDIEIKLALPEMPPQDDEMPARRTHYLTLITCRKSAT